MSQEEIKGRIESIRARVDLLEEKLDDWRKEQLRGGDNQGLAEAILFLAETNILRLKAELECPKMGVVMQKLSPVARPGGFSIGGQG